MKPIGLVALFLAGGLAAASVVACGSDDEGTTDDANITKGRKKGSSSGDDDTSSEEGRRPSTQPTPDSPTPVADAGADTGVPGAPVCGAIPTCANAKVLPAITGDGAGTTTAANGIGSQWLSIQVKEDSNAGEPLGITAYLDTKDGSQLDLFLYDANCTTVVDSHVGTAARKVVWLDWNDVPFLDNSRMLLLEVRHVSGACDAAHGWSMDIEGGSGL
jgi:hypothetical protein